MSTVCDIKKLKVLFTQEEIQQKIKELANLINQKYKNSEYITLICVLSGSCMFFSDLARLLKPNIIMEFVKVESYDETHKTTGKIKEILFDLKHVKNQDTIIVEDIIDTGITAQYLINRVNNFQPKSLCFISLLNKPCNRKINIQPDICGFEIDNKFLVGYGFDYDEVYRNLPYIGYFE